MALVLALAATAAVSGLLAWAQARVLARAREARRWRVEEELRVAAREAAREASWRVAADADWEVDHPGEDWAREVRHATEYGAEVRAWAEDGGRWVDWNNAGSAGQPGRDFREITRNLLACCGQFETDGFVGALVDWVDADEEGGKEKAWYARAGMAWEPPNRPMWGAGELRGVAGFDAAWYAKRDAEGAKDELFGGELGAGAVAVPADREAPFAVNVNTAGREALLAVAGVEHDALVRQAMALRAVRPFESTGALFAAHPEAAAALQGALDVKSRCFRVRAEAVGEGGARWRVNAWYEREDDGGVRCLQWAEGAG
ncbi:MAG: general secretion pathway protein GspK [Kiritimatiellae bacterium]|nr:general secretion pathway protein GspK [Kiritimatiellia bacterium]